VLAGENVLRDRRHELTREARSILDRAEAHGRDLTPEDRSQFDDLDGQITDVDRRIAHGGSAAGSRCILRRSSLRRSAGRATSSAASSACCICAQR
jgi:hypothetical protein